METLIGTIQIALALIQIKLDHFTRGRHRDNIDNHYVEMLSEGIRKIEIALSETIAYIAREEVREPNEQLARYWEEASLSLRNIPECAELANIMFEKHLYWRNPEIVFPMYGNQIYYISLDNVRNQLRTLRRRLEEMQRRRFQNM